MPPDQLTLAEKAVDSIYGLIVSGELPLGGIVNEVALSQRFNISRGPIREAVQRLQGLGLITREPYMRARIVSLSSKDLIEIFQLREAVESMACRLAARNMSDDALRMLGLEFDRARASIKANGGDAESFDLHVRIATGCGNERIRHLLCEDLYHLLRLFRQRSGSLPGRRLQAVEEHWQIIRALQIRDADLAESLMRSHIARATTSLLASAEAEEAAARPDGK